MRHTLFETDNPREGLGGFKNKKVEELAARCQNQGEFSVKLPFVSSTRCSKNELEGVWNCAGPRHPCWRCGKG